MSSAKKIVGSLKEKLSMPDKTLRSIVLEFARVGYGEKSGGTPFDEYLKGQGKVTPRMIDQDVAMLEKDPGIMNMVKRSDVDFTLLEAVVINALRAARIN